MITDLQKDALARAVIDNDGEVDYIRNECKIAVEQIRKYSGNKINIGQLQDRLNDILGIISWNAAGFMLRMEAIQNICKQLQENKQ